MIVNVPRPVTPVRPAIAIGFLVSCTVAVMLLVPRALAQDEPAPDWELLESYTGGALELHALPSGETIALGTDRLLFSSADDGDTWQSVPAPPNGHAAQVDPTDPSTIYGSSTTGVSKSTDGGASWTVILPSSDRKDPLGSGQFAISPVDHQLLYFAHAVQSRVLFDRSRDGGATWERTRDFTVPVLCTGLTHVLVPHPSDAQVVFSDLGCYAGRDRGTALLRSDDQGSSWHVVFRTGQDATVGRVSVAGPTAPARLYLTGDGFLGDVAARVFRSDDNGADWQVVLQAEQPRAWRFGGLAVDPTAPDVVWVALGSTPEPSETGVRVSSDAGQTWDFLGRQDIGWVNDLVRTADGQALLAATNEGIWRYRVATPAQPAV